MEISSLKLAELLIFSFVFGLCLGFFNDFNRIIRVFFGARYSSKDYSKLYDFFKIKNKTYNETTKFTTFLFKIIIIIQDVLFSLSVGCGTVLLIYCYNDGRFRLFTPLAIILGFFLYYFSVGKLVMLVSEPIAVFIKELLERILHLTFIPIKSVSKATLKVISKLYYLIKKHLAKRMNIRYNIKEVKRLAFLSKIGFINYRELKNEVES